MMTNEFKLACKKYAYKDRLGKIEYDDGVIAYDDFLQKIETTDSCYTNGNIIGTTNAKIIKVNTLDNYLLEDKDIQAKIGVKYPDSSEEYISVGKYTITKPNNQETAKIGEYTGYDDLRLLDEPYVCGITEWEGKTVKDVYKDLCDQLGLLPKTLEFINSDLPVNGNAFTNKETRRLAISNIAGVACSFVNIDYETNEIDLAWVDDEISETFTKDDYSNLEKNQVYGPVNSLIITDGTFDGENVVIEDEESIAEFGETPITISGNYFLYTEELRRQAINAIWERVKGFTYVNCKMTSYTGRPYLKCGNKISIEDDMGNYFNTYVLKHTFAYDGTFTSIIESPALTKEEIKTKNYVTAYDLFRETEAKVNKIDGEINLIVKEVKTTSEILSETNTNLNNNYPTTTDIEQQLAEQKKEITTEYSTLVLQNKNIWQAEVIEKINTDGVEKFKNMMVTIDIEGLKVAVNMNAFNTLQNNVGFYCRDGTELITKIDKDGTLTKDLKVTGTINTNLIQMAEFEENGEDYWGWYWVGD